MTTFLKFVHLGAIAIWSGGLIVLPFLFWQRRGLLPGRDLDRLHRLSRFVYVAMTSPAAFIAIGSGTALIFLQQTYEEWFSLKMVAVGAMVMLHVVAGLFLERIFDPDGRFSAFSYSALTGAYLVLITAILWIAAGEARHRCERVCPASVRSRRAAAVLRLQCFAETMMPMP